MKHRNLKVAPVVAQCKKCGRGFVGVMQGEFTDRWPDYTGDPCGGRVVIFDEPIPNESGWQDHPIAIKARTGDPQ